MTITLEVPRGESTGAIVGGAFEPTAERGAA